MPYSEGQVLNLAVSDLNHRGEGVGRSEGFTLFIPGALPGETVSARVTAIHKNYGEASLVGISKASEYRVSPRCPYFNRCGGCQLQHLSYKKQLTWKEEMVFETLRRLAGIKINVQPVLGMETPWNYRNKAQVHLGTEKTQITAGFYERESHNIIDIHDCPVQYPLNNEAMAVIRQSLEQYIECLPEKDKQSIPVSGVQIRSSFADKNCLITFQNRASNRDLVQLEHIAARVSDKIGNILAGIGIEGRSKKSFFFKTFIGQSHLTENIDSFKFRISPRSFFQVNPVQAAILYKKALLLAGHPATAYDLYCGTGNFSLYLSQVSEEVIGVDSEETAIEDARFNAKLNSRGNITFINARAEEIPSLFLKGKKPLTVFLNPPRKGCSAFLLDAVIKANPERIVYISCNPATLARDLAVFASHSFNLEQVQPVDMFPHTSHVETIASLQR